VSRARKFDWDEARRLHAEGLTYVEIGRRLGVTDMAIRFACDPEARTRANAYHDAWQRSGQCPDCGAQTTRRAGGVYARCRDCASRARVKVIDGTAYCPTCDTWKPLDQFSRSGRSPARGVHKECRPCDSARRRRWRIENRERERAYDRERRRRKRELNRRNAKAVAERTA
jgi:DNA-directed RNA polymerase subunit RPC12/RpoP